jgi:hypothetical protein
MLDNGASDTAKHASWFNEAELFFSLMSRKLLRRGESAFSDELVARIHGL